MSFAWTTHFIIVVILSLVITADGWMWPRIICHPWYDDVHQKCFPVANYQCNDGTHQRDELAKNYGITDRKGCILWRLKAILINKDKTYSYDPEQGLRRTLLTIFKGLAWKKLSREENQKRKAFVNEIIQKTSHCEKDLIQEANKEKLPSTEWKLFYYCIERAWGC